MNIRILIESYVSPEVDDEGNVVRGDADELWDECGDEPRAMRLRVRGKAARRHDCTYILEAIFINHLRHRILICHPTVAEEQRPDTLG